LPSKYIGIGGSISTGRSGNYSRPTRPVDPTGMFHWNNRSTSWNFLEDSTALVAYICNNRGPSRYIESPSLIEGATSSISSPLYIGSKPPLFKDLTFGFGTPMFARCRSKPLLFYSSTLDPVVVPVETPRQAVAIGSTI